MSFTVTIDSRESRCNVPGWLLRLGYQTEVAELPVGDYRINDVAVVERKAANDFAISVMDGRLWAQAELLTSSFQHAVIVVEGDLSTVHSGIEPESLAGALSALVVFYKLPVIVVRDEEATARLIGRLGKHVTEGLGYEIPLRVAKPKHDGGLAQYLVEGLPGVGAETARRLIQHFGAPGNVFAASLDELLQVKGVGAKTAAGIRAALDFAPTSFRGTKGAPTGTRK